MWWEKVPRSQNLMGCQRIKGHPQLALNWHFWRKLGDQPLILGLHHSQNLHE